MKYVWLDFVLPLCFRSNIFRLFDRWTVFGEKFRVQFAMTAAAFAFKAPKWGGKIETYVNMVGNCPESEASHEWRWKDVNERSKKQKKTLQFCLYVLLSCWVSAWFFRFNFFFFLFQRARSHTQIFLWQRSYRALIHTRTAKTVCFLLQVFLGVLERLNCSLQNFGGPIPLVSPLIVCTRYCYYIDHWIFNPNDRTPTRWTDENSAVSATNLWLFTNFLPSKICFPCHA